MPHSASILLLFLAGAGLLAAAALHDIGFRTVPNVISVALLVIGLVLRALQHDLPWGIGCGLLVFIVTYVFFWLGWMGGADVKLLASSAVLVAPAMVPTLVVGTSLAGGVLALIYIAGSRVVRPGAALRPPGLPRRNLLARALRCERRRLSRRGPLPYAAAIAVGGWLAISGS